MEERGGSLCVGCIEKRLGRELVPADFDPSAEGHNTPGPHVSARLASRRQDWRLRARAFDPLC
jgi:hypothetical protein